jgi:hypothetical protein
MAGGDCASALPKSVKLKTTDVTAPLEADLVLFLPALLAVSGTASHDCVAADQRVLKMRFMLLRQTLQGEVGA